MLYVRNWLPSKQSAVQLIVIVGLGVLLGVLLSSWWRQPITSITVQSNVVTYPELSDVQQLYDVQSSYDAYETYFQTLAEEKGAVYAFEVMKIAPLPHGLDTHLLGHAIGDILYVQKGVAGMADCTHDFRNACSHTIVIGALLEYGVQATEKIRVACEQAPGGTGAYTMCFHGLGHGVLAFNGYEMQSTVEMCRMMGTEKYHQREADQCFGGAVMEIISGGGHDREKWETQRAEYLQSNDPLALCDAEYLTAGERHFCYTYITPYLLEAVNGNVGRPVPTDWERVFAICDRVPLEDRLIRENCFGGAGKEFIGIVAGRDFRDGITLDQAGHRTMHAWCQLAVAPDGIAACQRSVTGSLYWGGENPIAVPLAFCHAAPDQISATVCYESLLQNVALYVPDHAYRAAVCAAMPSKFETQCHDTLLAENV